MSAIDCFVGHPAFGELSLLAMTRTGGLQLCCEEYFDKIARGLIYEAGADEDPPPTSSGEAPVRPAVLYNVKTTRVLTYKGA